jgi:hypothetical protein
VAYLFLVRSMKRIVMGMRLYILVAVFMTYDLLAPLPYNFLTLRNSSMPVCINITVYNVAMVSPIEFGRKEKRS